MKYPLEWFPSETLPEEEGVYVEVWIALRGGIVIPGRFIYSVDEASANYQGLWLNADSMAEVDAQYWMYRLEGHPRPEPPR